MLQTKIYRISKEEEVKEFNEFVIKHPPTGANGLKILPEYIMLTFDNGEIFGKDEKIRHLIGELNTLLLNQIDEVRQYKDTFVMLDTIDFYTRRPEWEEFYNGMKATRKNAELSAFKIDVIIETLNDLGHKVSKAEHPNLPELPEKPIIAKSLPENKNKKKK